MRSVRCEACGTKALVAASTCPKCGHEIAVRDGRGEMLPLAHCSTCDSFYPERLGECRWCGTKPARAPVGPYLWKGVGIATFVAMAWGAWLVHDDPPAEVSKARLEAVLKPDSSAGAIDSTVSAGALADLSSADSAAQVASTDVVPADSILQSVATLAAIGDSATQGTAPAPDTVATSTPVVVGDSAPPVIVEPVSEPEPVPLPPTAPVASPPSRSTVSAPRRVVTRPAESRAAESRAAESRAAEARAAGSRSPESRTVDTRSSETRPAPAKTSRTLARTPARAVVRPPSAPARTTRAATKPAPRIAATSKAAAKTPVKTPPKSRARAAWVNSVARNWVVVRASASRGSRVIASIGPNTRVQLGESRNGWRRIRAKGLAGWVEHRSFIARAGSRSGSLAAR